MRSKTLILKRTRQDLSFNIRQAYLIIALIFILDDPAPPPRWDRKHEFWNVLAKTFYFNTTHAYLIITFEYLYLMTPSHPNPKDIQTYSSRPFIWYTTCLSSENFVFLHPMTPPTPSNGSESMNSETYSSRTFIWYTTCLPYHNFEFLRLISPPPSGPKLWNLKPTRQDLQLYRDYSTYLVTWLWRHYWVVQKPGFSTTFTSYRSNLRLFVYSFNIIVGNSSSNFTSFSETVGPYIVLCNCRAIHCIM